MKRILILVPLTYLGVCLLMFLLQSKLIFFPGPPPESTPGEWGMDYTDLLIRTSDGVDLHAWWIPSGLSDQGSDGSSSEPRGAVVVAHGNGGNIEHRLGLARAFHHLGYSVLLFDYRGYGKSSGAPSEEGVYLDAEAAYDHVTEAEAVPPSKIVIYGESLGGGVAIELARRRECFALVTESAFLSIRDVAAHHYRWLPVRWLARQRFDNVAKLPDIRTPYLAIHSPDDEIVPYFHAEGLFDAANEPKALVTTRGGHNAGGFQTSSRATAEVEAFLERHRP